MSSSDAPLEAMDAITEQTHAACPQEALTGGQIPIHMPRRYFHSDKNSQLEQSHACRVRYLCEHRDLTLSIRILLR